MATSLGPKTARALHLLAEHGPLDSHGFLTRMWPNSDRAGKCAAQGGPPFAATAFLGRLRRRGFVQSDWMDGHWEYRITPAGTKAIR